jgi:GrpB-like predicted nucleotidyltransferase (UPF0157 family)
MEQSVAVSEPPVVISPYDPHWPKRADALIADLRTALGPAALRIDHIGSTAIPDMEAKDVLDLQVVVADLDALVLQFDDALRPMSFERVAPRLGHLYNEDNVPAGCDDDQALWRKRLWCRRNDAGGDVNLHARLLGSPNERLALLFRDWMRAHPEAIAPYCAIKRRLAAQAPDSDRYSDLKDPVVDLVIAVAEPWASATGWSTSTSS